MPPKQPTSRKTPGFIYIYTYKQMYESLVTKRVDHLKWLHMDYSILRNEKTLPLSKWSAPGQILCKVGMTRKPTVLARLLEWQNSCKHPIVAVEPSMVEELCKLKLQSSPTEDKTLSMLFRKLSLKGKKEIHRPSAEHQLKGLKCFRNGGFYVVDGSKLEDVEVNIHKLLWRRYGQGFIYCHGCKNEKGQPTRHKEWFLVPVSQLPDVFKAIDALCVGK